jgi:hypothetical protein
VLPVGPVTVLEGPVLPVGPDTPVGPLLKLIGPLGQPPIVFGP